MKKIIFITTLVLILITSLSVSSKMLPSNVSTKTHIETINDLYSKCILPDAEYNADVLTRKKEHDRIF